MQRPYLSYGIKQLETLAKTSPQEIDVIIGELEHRNSRAAKALKRQLSSNQSGQDRSNRPPELFTPNEVESTAPPPGRARASNWPTGCEYPPTDEQEIAVDAFLSKETKKITAFAGAGKTSTLKLLADTTTRERGLYLAFNKAIATEASMSFPNRVRCATTHSIALNTVRPLYDFTFNKWFSSLNARQLSSEWELDRYDAGPTTLEPDMIAFLALKTVRSFAQSGDHEILIKHVQLLGKALGLPPERKATLLADVFAMAQRLWAEMLDEDSDIPVGHDGYLKLWSLMKPKLGYDYIFLDEAQDTNSAVLSVLMNQPCQMIYVGDKHQQIYEWRGAENAMAKITDVKEVSLTRSFRFGQEIADEAGRILRAMGETRQLLGNPNRVSVVEPVGYAGTVLTRSNAMLFKEIMDALSEGKKPFVVGGTEEMKALMRDVDSLRDGRPGSHPDFFGFYNWKEVEEFAAGPAGEHLQAFVNLVNQMGRGALWKAVLSAEDEEEDADIVLSTAHKAKGCQWESVRLADDFSSSENESGQIPYSEARLFYVAMTRAKQQLVVDPVLVSAFAQNLSPDQALQSR